MTKKRPDSNQNREIAEKAAMLCLSCARRQRGQRRRQTLESHEKRATTGQTNTE
jgi:hypothetical protein